MLTWPIRYADALHVDSWNIRPRRSIAFPNRLQDDGFIFLWVTMRALELARDCLDLWGYACLLLCSMHVAMDSVHYHDHGVPLVANCVMHESCPPMGETTGGKYTHVLIGPGIVVLTS